MTFPFASRWRYDYKGLLTYRCLQDGTLKKHEKFEADWTMYIRVISELQSLPGSWRNIKIHRGATVTGINELSSF